VLPQDLTSEQLHAQLNILRTETELLSHELSLAMAHGSLAPSPHEASQGTTPVQTSGSHDSVAEMQRWQSLSRSQLGQDLWVLEQLGWKRGGYFVEFGATDGVLLSNTWLLEKHFDWHGICAEPNPAFFERLKRNRSCELSKACIFRTSGEQFSFVLADAYGGILEFAKEDSHLDKREAYASVGSLMEVTTTSLMDLLDQKQAPQQIDYLSIDTEGSELAVLEGIDWDRYVFRCITVEHNHTAQREEIAALLEGQGYERKEAQWDDWYMKRPW
jgi:FkbM family methyltransferase